MRPVALLVFAALTGSYPLDAQLGLVHAPVSELQAQARRDSNDVAAHYTLALALWDSARFDDVERQLHEALVLEPQYAPAYMALAYLAYARRPALWREETQESLPDSLRSMLQESYRLRRRAFLLDPLVDLRLVGAMARQAPGAPKQRGRSSPARQNPFDAFADADYAAALAGLDHVFVDPRRDVYFLASDLIRWYHGLAAAQLSKYEITDADFSILLDHARRREADSPGPVPLGPNDCRYVLALAKYRLGKPLDAVNLYQEAITNDLSMSMAHVQLARIYQDLRMWDKAIPESQRAVELEPGNPTLLVEHGLLLREAGRLPDAMTTWQEAIAANPREFRALYYLAQAQEELNQNDQAKETYQRFLALVPSRYEQWITEARKRFGRKS